MEMMQLLVDVSKRILDAVAAIVDGHATSDEPSLDDSTLPSGVVRLKQAILAIIPPAIAKYAISHRIRYVITGGFGAKVPATLPPISGLRCRIVFPIAEPKGPADFFLAGVLDSLTDDVLTVLTTRAKSKFDHPCISMDPIKPRDISQTISDDKELSELFPLQYTSGAAPPDVLTSVPNEIWDNIIDLLVLQTGAFVVSGCDGYAFAINGCYEPQYSIYGSKSKSPMHTIVYRQIENPCWCFKRKTLPKDSLTGLKSSEFSGWFATGFSVDHDTLHIPPQGYLRNGDSDASTPVMARRDLWESPQCNLENPMDSNLNGENFEKECAIVMRRALASDLERSKENLMTRKAHLKRVALSPVPLTAHDDYRFTGELEGPSWTWFPVRGSAESGDPWLLHHDRPVYSRCKLGARQEEDFEIRYTMAGGGQWQVFLRGCRRCWSAKGCDVASPINVLGWEYDDGHYAKWGLNDQIKFVSLDPATEKNDWSRPEKLT